METKLKNKKGITLIALVITIVVLIILATISINSVFGENGLIAKAEQGKQEYRAGSVQDEVSMWKGEKSAAKYDGLSVKTRDELIEDQLQRGLLTEEEATIAKNTGSVKIASQTIDYGEDDLVAATDLNPGELSGTGTAGDPYLIQSIEDIVAFSNAVNGGNDYDDEYVKLDLTLDFNSDKSYINPATIEFGDVNGNGTVEALKTELTTGAGFVPIGYSGRFGGTFDGENYSIKNLYISRENGNIGLFGYISYGGTVTNLTVSGKIVASNANVGGILGRAFCSAKIENCQTNVEITVSEGSAGGICGRTSGYTNYITNCINRGKITLTGSEASLCLGGILGYGANCDVTDSINYATLSIESTEEMLSQGELAGNNQESSISNCQNNGTLNRIDSLETISLQNNYLGGIVGYSCMVDL